MIARAAGLAHLDMETHSIKVCAAVSRRCCQSLDGKGPIVTSDHATLRFSGCHAPGYSTLCRACLNATHAGPYLCECNGYYLGPVKPYSSARARVGCNAPSKSSVHNTHSTQHTQQIGLDRHTRQQTKPGQKGTIPQPTAGQVLSSVHPHPFLMKNAPPKYSIIMAELLYDHGEHLSIWAHVRLCAQQPQKVPPTTQPNNPKRKERCTTSGTTNQKKVPKKGASNRSSNQASQGHHSSPHFCQWSHASHQALRSALPPLSCPEGFGVPCRTAMPRCPPPSPA